MRHPPTCGGPAACAAVRTAQVVQVKFTVIAPANPQFLTMRAHRHGKGHKPAHGGAVHSSGVILDAAALQEHLMRTGSVADIPLKRIGSEPRKAAVSGPPTSAERGPALRATSSGPGAPAALAIASIRDKTLLVRAGAAAVASSARRGPTLASALAVRWSCDACGNLNSSPKLCSSCSSTRERSEKRLPLVAPSLAQLRGLVPSPTVACSPSQWRHIEASAAARIAVQKHSRSQHQCCAVCMEPFKLRPVSLLSCSHTFHTTCIASLERYMTSTCGASPACPLCRASPFERIETRIHAEAHVAFAAVQVQSMWRMMLAMKRLDDLKRKAYLTLGGDAFKSHPARARAFVALSMKRLAKRVDDLNAARADAVEVVLTGVEHALDETAALLARAAQVGRRRAATSTAVTMPVVPTPAPTRTVIVAPTPTPAAALPPVAAVAVQVDWAAVYRVACQRGGDASSSSLAGHECAICCCSATGSGTAVLTSCGHVYHSACIATLEGMTSTAASCPMCRAKYSRVDAAAAAAMARSAASG